MAARAHDRDPVRRRGPAPVPQGPAGPPRGRLPPRRRSDVPRLRPLPPLGFAPVPVSTPPLAVLPGLSMQTLGGRPRAPLRVPGLPALDHHDRVQHRVHAGVQGARSDEVLRLLRDLHRGRGGARALDEPLLALHLLRDPGHRGISARRARGDARSPLGQQEVPHLYPERGRGDPRGHDGPAGDREHAGVCRWREPRDRRHPPQLRGARVRPPDGGLRGEGGAGPPPRVAADGHDCPDAGQRSPPRRRRGERRRLRALPPDSSTSTARTLWSNWVSRTW